MSDDEWVPYIKDNLIVKYDTGENNCTAGAFFSPEYEFISYAGRGEGEAWRFFCSEGDYEGEVPLQDGTTKSTTINEIKTINTIFNKPSEHHEHGFWIGGERYKFVQGTQEEGDLCGLDDPAQINCVLLRSGKKGIFIFKIPSVLYTELWILTYFDEDNQDVTATAKDATIKFGKQIIDEGY